MSDEGQREFLLGRIKVHLHALKKYTYGKHIVARVEKLIASAGEPQDGARRLFQDCLRLWFCTFPGYSFGSADTLTLQS